jgi:flagellin-like hook-associated protein FlgL
MISISSILADRSPGARLALSRSLTQENRTLQRLATLRRINRGSDDPAGLIAAANLESELRAIEAAEVNAARADAMLTVADSGLAQIGELLNTIEASALAAAGDTATEAEKAAYQQQIDAAVEAIDRIGATTQFGDRKLLDGSTPSLSFALSANPAEAASVPLLTVDSGSLGGAAGVLLDLASGGTASVAANDPATSINILRQARSQLLTARAQIGAFQGLVVESSRRVLATSSVELSSALSMIRDAEVAAEASLLVRSRLLSSAALSAVRYTGQQARGLAALLSA